MELGSKEERDFWKEVTKRRMTADGLVSPDHCFLYSVIATGKDSKKCNVKVYDGHGATDDFFLNVRSDTAISKQLNFDPPMYFRKGLYVDLCGDTESVVLHFLPVKE